ncbi:hypothetical protein AVEN_19080-1 [Araneus ventricosus]|uniref:Uncharacterized protein n=1 Tax=Araneus ventricosus TaxID=182803 RepID=A0A4Y2NFU6_ARAVE|nr:hypothetical protein AVEN_19080-1 [Araneus ventricosus]
MGVKYHLMPTNTPQFNTEEIPSQHQWSSTTPAAALQVNEGFTILHIKAQMESILVTNRVSIVFDMHPPDEAIYTDGHI